MNIAVNAKITRNVKTMKIHTKVCDSFSYQLMDANNECILDQEDGYVPTFMPGEHYGDYIILDIDIETGLITNWKKLIAHDIEESWPDVE